MLTKQKVTLIDIYLIDNFRGRSYIIFFKRKYFRNIKWGNKFHMILFDF